MNGTLVLGQDEALTGGQIAGLNLADQTATADIKPTIKYFMFDAC